VSELLKQVNMEGGQRNAKGHGGITLKGGNANRKSNMQAKICNGAPMRTVLKTGGHTSLWTEIYGPMAVYLRLLALLVATYSGTAQCYDYSDKRCNKGGGRGTQTRKDLMYLFRFEGSGGQAEVRAGVGGDLFLC
jgi:hypothetical protein